ncbi:DUF1542 domain-containing protein [Corynebacterium choanae]
MLFVAVIVFIAAKMTNRQQLPAAQSGVALGAGQGQSAHGQLDFADALADARRWTERLGGQVLNLTGSDAASTQALADAAERFTAANSALSQAQTVRQALLARESALEGLYYVDAAREIMGMPKGPKLPPLEGQQVAGQVTETRTINYEGQQVTASPVATAATPNYYPGGRVAGRPVPAGWYSTPWWASALASGMWTAGSVLMFSSLFHGMSGIGYNADAFAAGVGDGTDMLGGDMLGGDTAGLGDSLGGDGGGLFDGGFFGGDGGGLFDGGFDFDL